MSKARKLLAHLEDIRAIRALQERAAEQDAHDQAQAVEAAELEASQHTAAKQECISAWEESTAGGTLFNPMMAGLWATELFACERREAEAKEALARELGELAVLRAQWQQAMTMAERAAHESHLGRRRFLQIAEEARLHETADLAALRVHSS